MYGITAGVFSNNISFLLASRIIQGVGLAVVLAAFSLLRDTFPPEKLAIAVGVFGSAYSAGSVIGLLAGAHYYSDVWMAFYFLIYNPICSRRDHHSSKICKRKQKAINN